MTVRQSVVGSLLAAFSLAFAGPAPAEQEQVSPPPLSKEDSEIVALLELLELMEMLKDLEVLSAFEEENKK